MNCKLFSDENKPYRSLTRDSKFWSGIIGQDGHGYKERLPYKQGLCRTASGQTRQFGDGMPMNCVRDLVPTMTLDLKPKLSVRELRMLHTENSVSRPPDDSQDEVAIAEVMWQTDTTANGNANHKHGSLSDGITTICQDK